MQNVKLVVFAYNFPHRKTQDILMALFIAGYTIDCVIATDPVKLNIPPSTVRTKLRHGALFNPRTVAERIGCPYRVMPHRGPELLEFLKSLKPDLGVIAGARILKKEVIDAFRTGIINFHPGLIPEARGLDALLWSIHKDIPAAVTAHLIDEHVDAGTILLRQELPIYPDDTVLDLSERLYETQLEILERSIEAALKGEGFAADPKAPHNRKMPGDLEKATLEKVPQYVQRFATSKAT